MSTAEGLDCDERARQLRNIAEEAKASAESRDTEAVDRLEREVDQHQNTLDWLRRERPGEGLAIAALLWQFWQYRGRLSEARWWLEAFLERSHEHSEHFVEALLGAGFVARDQGDLDAASRFTQQAIEQHSALTGDYPSRGRVNFGLIQRFRGDYDMAIDIFVSLLRSAPAGRGHHVRNLGAAHLDAGNRAGARPYLYESLELLKALPHALSLAHRFVGRLEMEEGNYAESREHLLEATRLATLTTDRIALGAAMRNLGALDRLEGSADAAGQLLGARAMLAETGAAIELALTEMGQGVLALAQSRANAALSLLIPSLETLQRIGHRRGVAQGLCFVALALAQTTDGLGGRADSALLLMAAADAVQPLDTILARADRKWAEETEAEVRHSLGDRADDVWQQGHALTRDEAVRRAVECARR